MLVTAGFFCRSYVGQFCQGVRHGSGTPLAGLHRSTALSTATSCSGDGGLPVSVRPVGALLQ